MVRDKVQVLKFGFVCFTLTLAEIQSPPAALRINCISGGLIASMRQLSTFLLANESKLFGYVSPGTSFFCGQSISESG
jgi:hypothetical protein